MLINPNVAFYVLWILVIAFFLGSLVAAIISSYNRGTQKSCFEVLRSMGTDPIFLAAFVSGGWAAINGQFDAMFSVFLGFVGLKVIATEYIIVKNGDFRYYWFGEGSGFNKWASATISTKSFILILGAGAIWFAGLYGYIDGAKVSERVLEMVLAWGLANGIPLVTMLKGKDFSFLNPVPKPKPVQILPPAPAPIAPPVVEPEPVTAPVITFPDFMEKNWTEEATARASKVYYEITPTSLYKASEQLSFVRACYKVSALIDYIDYKLDKAAEMFKHTFGFTYKQRNDNDSLKTLRDYCSKQPKSFESYMTYAGEYGYSGHVEVWRELLESMEQAALKDKVILNSKELDDKLQSTRPDGSLLAYSYGAAVYALKHDWKDIIA